MGNRKAGIENELSHFREQIDRIDEQLIELLAARYAVVLEVLALKKASGMPAIDRAREDAVADRLESLAAGKLPPGVAKRLARIVITVLRDEAAFRLGWYAGH